MLSGRPDFTVLRLKEPRLSFFKFCFGHGTLSDGRFAVLWNPQQGGDTAYAERGRQFLFLVHVYFVDVDFAVIFLSQLFQHRGKSLHGPHHVA